MGVARLGQSARALSPDKSSYGMAKTVAQEDRQICAHVWVSLEMSCEPQSGGPSEMNDI